MLKITVEEAPAPRRIKLEGKLYGVWVDEVARTCRELEPAPLELDLAAVGYADANGARLLQTLAGRGVRLVACSPFVAELLRQEGVR